MSTSSSLESRLYAIRLRLSAAAGLIELGLALPNQPDVAVEQGLPMLQTSIAALDELLENLPLPLSEWAGESAPEFVATWAKKLPAPAARGVAEPLAFQPRTVS